MWERFIPSLTPWGSMDPQFEGKVHLVINTAGLFGLMMYRKGCFIHKPPWVCGDGRPMVRRVFRHCMVKVKGEELCGSAAHLCVFMVCHTYSHFILGVVLF